MDRNGNDKIDDGTELFGNCTSQPASLGRNGFAARAMYDGADQGGDGDGWIGSSDAIFMKLRLWQDKNHNGRSEPEELATLPELGVTGISLAYKDSKWTDMYGNRFHYRAKILREKAWEAKG